MKRNIIFSLLFAAQLYVIIPITGTQNGEPNENIADNISSLEKDKNSLYKDFLTKTAEILDKNSYDFKNDFYLDNPLATILYNEQQQCWDKTVQLNGFLRELEKESQKITEQEELHINLKKREMIKNLIAVKIKQNNRLETLIKESELLKS